MSSRRRHAVPLISAAQRAALRSELTDMVEYRKSGLSLNWIVGCPLDCSYCVRHLFDNFEMKVPRALVSDEDAFAALIGHAYFRPGLTPIQLLNRATDPLLPTVKPHTFSLLKMLDDAGFRNHVLIISRWRLDAEDCRELNSYSNIQLTLLFTYSGITDKRIEPVDSDIAAQSLTTAHAHAIRYRTVLYWRPIVPGLNDSPEHIERALDLSSYAHATVFTGLFYRDAIREYYQAHGLPEPYDEVARRKFFPQDLEARILDAASRRGKDRLFRKTSCAVAYVHGVGAYNGHACISELCDICPASQRSLCRESTVMPDLEVLATTVGRLGGRILSVSPRSVIVEGLDEEKRYLVQHQFSFQVHDASKPHHVNQHGRADLGWPKILTEGEPS